MGLNDLKDLKTLSSLRSQIDGISVDRIIIRDFPTLEYNDKVKNAMICMKESGLQEIPLVDNGRYLGMISYDTILKNTEVNMNTGVGSIVKNIPPISKDTEITKIAEDLLVNNCRQLAVIENDTLIGLVSRNGIVRVASNISLLKEIRTWEMMSTPVYYLKPESTMRDAIEIMRRANVKTIPIMNDKEIPLGAIGMREVIDCIERYDPYILDDFVMMDGADIRLDSVRTENAYTVEWDSDLGSTSKMMTELNTSMLPIMDEGFVVGVLSKYDIVELVSSCRVRDALFVQYSGLEGIGNSTVDRLYNDVSLLMGDVYKYCKPESFTIRISKDIVNDIQRFCLSGRVFAECGTFQSTVYGDDLVQTNRDLIETIRVHAADLEKETDHSKKTGRKTRSVRRGSAGSNRAKTRSRFSI